MVCEDEHLRVIRRLIAPPAFPLFVGPGTSDWSEHVAAENPRADAGKTLRRHLVVDTGFTSVLAVHLAPRASVKEPVEDLLAAHTQRMLQVLIRPGRVTIDRCGKAQDAHSWHGLSFAMSRALLKFGSASSACEGSSSLRLGSVALLSTCSRCDLVEPARRLELVFAIPGGGIGEQVIDQARQAGAKPAPRFPTDLGTGRGNVERIVVVG